MDEREVSIRIHGREYKISSIKDPVYTRLLAEYCNEIMEKVDKSSGGSSDFIHLSVLAMLQMAHNYYEMKRKAEDGSDLWDPEFDKLIQTIKDAEKKAVEKEKKAVKKK